jgi:uncharacterized protein (DUF4415 family)
MNKPSQTDWARINEMTDEQIDTSDIPLLDDSFWERATLRLPKKIEVTVEIDADTLGWFQAQGENYQRSMSEALRLYVETHKAPTA